MISSVLFPSALAFQIPVTDLICSFIASMDLGLAPSPLTARVKMSLASASIERP